MRTRLLFPERMPKLALRLGSLFLFALGWEWAAQYSHSLLLPGLFATLQALLAPVTSPALWNALMWQKLLLPSALPAILTGLRLGLDVQ